MSRDTRDAREDQLDVRSRPGPDVRQPHEGNAREHAPSAARHWSPADRLALPRSDARRPISVDRQGVRLRESDIELLATVGAFRTVAVRDLRDIADNATDRLARTAADLRSLREQGLLETHAIVINGRHESVAVLTEKGHRLLEHSRGDESLHRDQRYYAGLVKPRELAHDAQLYRMFEREREHLEREGAIVTRVLLDYELKADYHRSVHEQQRKGIDPGDARRAFAEAQDLPFADGHIHFPDVRVEYQTPDGRSEHRDLELATEHYSRAQLSGKQGAGFHVYRATGAGASRRGSSCADPHHLEWLG